MASFNDIRTALADAGRSAVGDMNVFGYLPRRPPSPALVIRTVKPSADYATTWGGGYAEWTFELLLIAGRVSEESAQNFLGDMISPNSPLIQAINNIEFPGGPGYGHAHVRQCNIADIKVGATKYACARLAVLVRA